MWENSGKKFQWKCRENPGLEFLFYIDALKNSADILDYIFAADPKMLLQFI